MVSIDHNDLSIDGGRLVIDGEVAQDSSRQVAAAIKRLHKELKKRKKSVYALIVPPGLGEERAKLLPKTDTVISCDHISGAFRKPLFEVVLAERDGSRPVQPVLQRMRDSKEVLSFQDIAPLEKEVFPMNKILDLKSIWEFLEYLQHDLHIPRQSLAALYKAAPQDPGRQTHSKYRDYLLFLQNIWPENTALQERAAAFNTAELEKRKERKEKGRELKIWQAIPDEEKLETIKTTLPQALWDEVENREQLQLFIDTIKEHFGIATTAFQSFLFEVAKRQPVLFSQKPNHLYSSKLTLEWFYYFYRVVWGTKHPHQSN